MSAFSGLAEMSAEKVAENRLRRAAARQGLKLVKSQTRDPRALGYGLFALVDADNSIVFGGGGVGPYGYAATLDEVERHLLGAD